MPKAPSTWSQPPAACVSSAAARRSSHAPVLTFPDCTATTIGSPRIPASVCSSSAMSMAPFASAATTSISPSPRPRSRSDRSTVAWRSAPATTRTRGASRRPLRCTSHPTRERTVCRPAASPIGVGFLTAGRESDRCLCRDAQQLLEPSARHLFGDSRGGRVDDVEAVLVPGRRHHVGSDGGLCRPSRHEAEVAGASGRDDSGVDAGHQLIEDIGRVERLVVERPTELGSENVDVGGHTDRSVCDVRAECCRAGGHAGEEVVKVCHGVTVRLAAIWGQPCCAQSRDHG